MEEVLSRNISVTLADFKFSADATNSFAILSSLESRDDEIDEPGLEDVPNAAPGGGDNATEDFFQDDDDYVGFDPNEGGGGGFFGGDDNDANFDDRMGDNGTGPGFGFGPAEPFDPSSDSNGAGLVMSMGGDGDGALLEQIDQSLLKNWAGPEHWKLRRVRKGE